MQQSVVYVASSLPILLNAWIKKTPTNICFSFFRLHLAGRVLGGVRAARRAPWGVARPGRGHLSLHGHEQGRPGGPQRVPRGVPARGHGEARAHHPGRRPVARRAPARQQGMSYSLKPSWKGRNKKNAFSPEKGGSVKKEREIADVGRSEYIVWFSQYVPRE